MSKPVPEPAFHPASAPDFLPLPQLRGLQLRRLQAVSFANASTTADSSPAT